MSERSAGGGLGRGLTGEFGEFGEDDTVRLRGNVWSALALCAFVFAFSAFFLLVVV